MKGKKSNQEMTDLEREMAFRNASRRLLFRGEPDSPIAAVPGAGKSAAQIPTRHVRQKITINLDSDIIEFFKARADEEGTPYQFLINQILRDYVRGTRTEQLSKDVSEALLMDKKFLQRLAARLGAIEGVEGEEEE